jgi:hypothetical protein
MDDQPSALRTTAAALVAHRQIFEAPRWAAAILDRLLLTSVVLNIDGDSTACAPTGLARHPAPRLPSQPSPLGRTEANLPYRHIHRADSSGQFGQQTLRYLAQRHHWHGR